MLSRRHTATKQWDTLVGSQGGSCSGASLQAEAEPTQGEAVAPPAPQPAPQPGPALQGPGSGASPGVTRRLRRAAASPGEGPQTSCLFCAPLRGCRGRNSLSQACGPMNQRGSLWEPAGLRAVLFPWSFTLTQHRLVALVPRASERCC